MSEFKQWVSNNYEYWSEGTYATIDKPKQLDDMMMYNAGVSGLGAAAKKAAYEIYISYCECEDGDGWPKPRMIYVREIGGSTWTAFDVKGERECVIVYKAVKKGEWVPSKV